MSAWMNTPSTWDDHRYAIPAREPSRRLRLFFRLVDGACRALRWAKK